MAGVGQSDGDRGYACTGKESGSSKPPSTGDGNEGVAEHQEQICGREERGRRDDLKDPVAVVGCLADETKRRLECDQAESGREVSPLDPTPARELVCSDR